MYIKNKLSEKFIKKRRENEFIGRTKIAAFKF